MKAYYYESNNRAIKIGVAINRKEFPRITARRKAIIKDKLLGVGLVLVGLAAMWIFKGEDCTAQIVVIGLGLLRMVF